MPPLRKSLPSRAVTTEAMTGDRGPTLNDALDRWIEALPTERTRSGDPYEPGTIRDLGFAR
jgi:hypothetical protein